MVICSFISARQHNVIFLFHLQASQINNWTLVALFIIGVPVNLLSFFLLLQKIFDFKVSLKTWFSTLPWIPCNKNKKNRRNTFELNHEESPFDHSNRTPKR